MGFVAALLRPEEDLFSEKCRNQIVLLLVDMLGKWFREDTWHFDHNNPPVSNRMWRRIQERLQRKLGKLSLAHGVYPIDECLNFVTRAEDEEIIALLSICFEELRSANPTQRQKELSEIKVDVYDAGNTLNHIFKENEIPYQWSGFALVRDEKPDAQSRSQMVPSGPQNQKSKVTKSESASLSHIWLSMRFLLAISVGSIIAYLIVTHPQYFFWITRDQLYIVISQAITMAIAGVCVLFIVVPHRWDALLATSACLAMGFVGMLLVCRPPNHLHAALNQQDGQARLAIKRTADEQTQRPKEKGNAPLTKP